MIEFLEKHLELKKEYVEVPKDQISEIIEYITSHYQDVCISSQQIGEKLEIPYRILLNEFKLKTGYSVNEYIMTIRIRKSYSLRLLY